MPRPTGRSKPLVVSAALIGLQTLAAGADNLVFAELVAHNGLRSAALLEYIATRTYQVRGLSSIVRPTRRRLWLRPRRAQC
jgi:hypothetical protein